MPHDEPPAMGRRLIVSVAWTLISCDLALV